MRKTNIRYVCLLAILICTNGFASEERLQTGFIQELSERSIMLDMKHTGITSSIGFLCEAQICKSVKDFKVGDEVLLTLGAIDNANILLSIRKCVIEDAQCNKVKELDINEESERKSQHEIFLEEHRLCRNKMKKDLANEFRDIHDHKTRTGESEQIVKQYNSMIRQPEIKECLDNFVNLYRDSVLQSCLKHECGNNIGGGCYHIVGYAVTTPVIEAAIKKCSI